MKVLVTGGTGVVGEGVVSALLERGHEVRLLSRDADRDVRRWPHGAEALAGDVASAADVRGSAKGCGAVVHMAGIDQEDPPDLTFDKVNVLGTRHMVKEAERARVKRLVFLSSLGAERGTSEYHESKRRAEDAVRGSKVPWVILRAGGAYGPGDHLVSTLLHMARTLPALPVVGDGAQRIQPIWHEDLGRAVAAALAKAVTGQTLDVAGPEQTSMTDLFDRLVPLVGRDQPRVHVPASLATLGVQAARSLGVKPPVSEAQLVMLQEESVIPPSGQNALTSILGVTPTMLDDGLRRLIGDVPEQTPSEGFGSLAHKRYFADIAGSYHRAAALREVFRREAREILGLDAQPSGGPGSRLKKNDTFTLPVPLRGVVAMRVEDIQPDRIVAVTLQGHPLAGAITFHFVERGKLVRFEVEVHARGANVVDATLMGTVGAFLQDVNWQAVAQRMVEMSGGRAAEGVQTKVEVLDDDQAAEIDAWVDGLVLRRQRGLSPTPPRATPRADRRRAPRAKPATGKKTSGARKTASARKKPAARKKKVAATRAPGSRRSAAGTGSARRTRAGSGSARKRGTPAPRSAARKAAKKSR